ncbi:hypothetical protein F4677DRAFT_315171 [Hypoxylon crocopeplum]|nr:hypothetical protein F4677DRAFT_315171 [Hypoxylon crocopeplum]
MSNQGWPFLRDASDSSSSSEEVPPKRVDRKRTTSDRQDSARKAPRRDSPVPAMSGVNSNKYGYSYRPTTGASLDVPRGGPALVPPKDPQYLAAPGQQFQIKRKEVANRRYPPDSFRPPPLERQPERQSEMRPDSAGSAGSQTSLKRSNAIRRVSRARTMPQAGEGNGGESTDLNKDSQGKKRIVWDFKELCKPSNNTTARKVSPLVLYHASTAPVQATSNASGKPPIQRKPVPSRSPLDQLAHQLRKDPQEVFAMRRKPVGSGARTNQEALRQSWFPGDDRFASLGTVPIQPATSTPTLTNDRSGTSATPSSTVPPVPQIPQAFQPDGGRSSGAPSSTAPPRPQRPKTPEDYTPRPFDEAAAVNVADELRSAWQRQNRPPRRVRFLSPEDRGSGRDKRDKRDTT